MRLFWAWLSAHHQSLSVTLASLSVLVAAVLGTMTFVQKIDESQYQTKRETLAFLLQYSSATRIRGDLAQERRLQKYFDREATIPDDLIIDVTNDKDGTNDAVLRGAIIDLVNYNEMLAMGRQKGILDEEMFDLQLKEVLKADFRVLKKFLVYSRQNKDASYPYWADALKDWDLESSEIR